MNYIKQLQADKAEALATIQAYKSTITDLKSYLLSDKFHNDTTVQVQDVWHRLDANLDFYMQQAITTLDELGESNEN